MLEGHVLLPKEMCVFWLHVALYFFFFPKEILNILTTPMFRHYRFGQYSPLYVAEFLPTRLDKPHHLKPRGQSLAFSVLRGRDCSC